MKKMLKPFDFVYSHAIVCRVPNCLKDTSYKQKENYRLDPIDIDRAIEEHSAYISVLRQLGLDVIELQADETLPDSVFVDCTAIYCNGTALIAQPHLASRKRECEIIRCLLKKEGISVINITDPVATIDASDVLFTGREFFVGISKRTNIMGAKALASAFPDVPVASIKIKKALHLKSYVTMAGPDILAIGSCDIAQDILKQMKEIAEYRKYQVITLPDNYAANCIYVNGTLLHCSETDFPLSSNVFNKKIDYPRIQISNHEFIKLNRFLTCRTLLFSTRYNKFITNNAK